MQPLNRFWGLIWAFGDQCFLVSGGFGFEGDLGMTTFLAELGGNNGIWGTAQRHCLGSGAFAERHPVQLLQDCRVLMVVCILELPCACYILLPGKCGFMCRNL